MICIMEMKLEALPVHYLQGAGGKKNGERERERHQELKPRAPFACFGEGGNCFEINDFAGWDI